MVFTSSRNKGAVRSGALASFNRVKQGFLFPFDDIHPSLLAKPVDLGSGWTLRKSSVSEWKEFGVYQLFEDWTQHRFGWRNLVPPQGYYLEDGKYRPSIKFQPEWRFAVIEANPDSVGLGPNSLSQALFLSPWQMHIGARSTGKSNPLLMSCWQDFPGLGVRSVTSRSISDQTRSSFGFPEFIFDPGILPNLDDLQLVRQVVEFRRKYAPANLTGAMYRMMALDRLIDREPLKALGYFAIIESLLTHAPARGDPQDSITRQLKRNLTLIETQLEPLGLAIGFDEHFNCKLDKVVGCLYSFRSSLAHGGEIEKVARRFISFHRRPNDIDYTWIVRFVGSICRGIIISGLYDNTYLMEVKG